MNLLRPRRACNLPHLALNEDVPHLTANDDRPHLALNEDVLHLTVDDDRPHLALNDDLALKRRLASAAPPQARECADARRLTCAPPPPREREGAGWVLGLGFRVSGLGFGVRVRVGG